MATSMLKGISRTMSEGKQLNRIRCYASIALALLVNLIAYFVILQIANEFIKYLKL